MKHAGAGFFRRSFRKRRIESEVPPIIPIQKGCGLPVPVMRSPIYRLFSVKNLELLIPRTKIRERTAGERATSQINYNTILTLRGSGPMERLTCEEGDPYR